MGKIRPFEIVLIAVFAIAGLIGLIYLANIKADPSETVLTYGAKVVIWGTQDAEAWKTAIASIGEVDEEFAKVVVYEEHDERSFENELVNAIAEGVPPDLVFIPHDMIVSLRSKLLTIPFETVPLATFRVSYIDGAEIFVLGDGGYAVPVGVDPLVLYYNRDLLANAGIANPPRTWEAVMNDAVPKLTLQDNRRNLSQSGISLGEYMNVRNAKEVLSMLFLQAGVSIGEEQNGRYYVTLGKTIDKGTPPAQSALNFYTQFASQDSNAYTWSRSMQFDRSAFTAGKLAMYIGFQSEEQGISEENPNLSYGIVRVPQAENATALRNYGTFYGLGIVKSSQNRVGAYTAAMRVASPDLVSTITEALRITPVARSLFGGTNDELYGKIFEESALVARGWLDPAPRETRGVFKAMVEEITFGRGDAVEAVGGAVTALDELYK